MAAGEDRDKCIAGDEVRRELDNLHREERTNGERADGEVVVAMLGIQARSCWAACHQIRELRHLDWWLRFSFLDVTELRAPQLSLLSHHQNGYVKNVGKDR